MSILTFESASVAVICATDVPTVTLSRRLAEKVVAKKIGGFSLRTMSTVTTAFCDADRVNGTPLSLTDTVICKKNKKKDSSVHIQCFDSGNFTKSLWNEAFLPDRTTAKHTE